jgi:surfactin synthase thioesterase subunit
MEAICAPWHRSEACSFQIIRGEIDKAPYALFGHSMGGMVAYELCHKIKEHGLPLPLHVFFSGRYAPQVTAPNHKNYNLMTDEEFKNEVMGLGGTPREFFEYPELLELFLPLLKNDFQLAETEIRGAEITPLDGAITVFLGKEDDLTPEQCVAWKKHTRRLCTIYYFEGGHFFLHDETEQLLKIINQILSNAYNDTPVARSNTKNGW